MVDWIAREPHRRNYRLASRFPSSLSLDPYCYAIKLKSAIIFLYEWEVREKSIVSGNTITPAPLKNAKSVSFSVFVVIIAVVTIIVIGGLYFYLNLTKTGDQPIILGPKQGQLSVPDDLIFLQGFQNTGREWPVKEGIGLRNWNKIH